MTFCLEVCSETEYLLRICLRLAWSFFHHKGAIQLVKFSLKHLFLEERCLFWSLMVKRREPEWVAFNWSFNCASSSWTRNLLVFCIHALCNRCSSAFDMPCSTPHPVRHFLGLQQCNGESEIPYTIINYRKTRWILPIHVTQWHFDFQNEEVLGALQTKQLPCRSPSNRLDSTGFNVVTSFFGNQSSCLLTALPVYHHLSIHLLDHEDKIFFSYHSCEVRLRVEFALRPSENIVLDP